MNTPSRYDWKFVLGPRWREGSLLAWLVVLMVGCQDRPVSPSPPVQAVSISASQPWPPDNRRTDAFAGSESCRECHQELCDQYSSHPMAQATRPIQAFASAPWEQAVTLERGGREYAVDQTPAGLSHAERARDESGECLYDQGSAIDYAIGSGKRGFSFVTVRGNLLYQSPLTWYSEGKLWDLSPGYDPASHPRFERQISDGCIACHVGRANPVGAGQHRFGSPVFEECAIGCERCHGPGQSHIAFQQGTLNAPQDPIVNPQKLSPAARESVCYQCHLHGVRRVLREQRTEYDFRPGDLLSDVWVVFTKGTGIEGTGQTSAVSQVEQIVSSQCFRQSKGEFGCISCHDPHGTPPVEQSEAYFRDRCLKCHDSATVECGISQPDRVRRNGDSCIACHMPALAANDVPHTSQTDHRILRRPGMPVGGLAGGSELTPFEPRSFPLAEADIQRAFGLMMSEAGWSSDSAGLNQSSATALSPFVGSSRQDGPILKSQAGNLIRLGQFDAGVQLAETALRQDPESETLLELLSIGLEAQGEHAAALEAVDKFLELNSWNSHVLSRRVTLLHALHRDAEAISAAQAALQWNPWLHPIRELLIELARASNNHNLAEEQERVLQELQQKQQAASSPAGSQ